MMHHFPRLADFSRISLTIINKSNGLEQCLFKVPQGIMYVCMHDRAIVNDTKNCARV